MLLYCLQYCDKQTLNHCESLYFWYKQNGKYLPSRKFYLYNLFMQLAGIRASIPASRKALNLRFFFYYFIPKAFCKGLVIIFFLYPFLCSLNSGLMCSYFVILSPACMTCPNCNNPAASACEPHCTCVTF